MCPKIGREFGSADHRNSRWTDHGISDFNGHNNILVHRWLLRYAGNKAGEFATESGGRCTSFPKNWPRLQDF